MDILFYGQFVATKVGATGLTVTIDIRRIERSTETASTVSTGASATEWWKGVYRYRLTGADVNVYDYVGVFITSDGSVDQQEVPALWTRFSEAITTDATGDITLSSDGVDGIEIESGINLRQCLSLALAALAGKASGLDTNTPIYKGADNSTTRISATTDANGNRSAVTLTPPA